MGITGILNGINAVQSAINGNSAVGTGNFQNNGFLIPASFTASSSGLPSSQVPFQRPGQLRRNIITWFVPSFGTISMFVNPNQIVRHHRKLIQQDRTKGGYTLQYWGEDLDVLNISGTTGSSGIEGINVLYEIYRAEQYAFDATSLVLAGQNAGNDLSNSLSGVGGAIGGGVGAAVGGVLGGLAGLDGASSNLTSQNIPSLAQNAFSVEMYYGGAVYRGFFNEMTVTESADNFMIQYSMVFVSTQTRGYRLNQWGWQKSANTGFSTPGMPHSYSGIVSPP
jgi:hypothetical protein